MDASESLILNQKQILQKIRRIAFQIYENNFSEKQVVLAGIHDQGYVLAELLHEALIEIATFEVKIIGIQLDKLTPTQGAISLDCDIAELKNKAIVLIDDVSNTGRTMAYSLKPFLTIKVKKIETAVLVNRSHSQFPLAINYSGFELATTFKEHVKVALESGNMSVYLI